MNDDAIADLKQFIAATVSQMSVSLREEIKEDTLNLVREEVAKLDAKMTDGFAGVADAIDTLAESIEPRLDDHGARITKLEQQTS